MFRSFRLLCRYRGTTPAADRYIGTTPAADRYIGTTPAADRYIGTTPAADRTLGAVVTSPRATFVWFPHAYFWTPCYVPFPCVPFPITRNNYICYICDVCCQVMCYQICWAVFHYHLSLSWYCAIEVPIKMFFSMTSCCVCLVALSLLLLYLNNTKIYLWI